MRGTEGDAAAAQGGRLAEAAAAALAGAEVDRGVQLSCGEHSDYGLLHPRQPGCAHPCAAGALLAGRSARRASP